MSEIVTGASDSGSSSASSSPSTSDIAASVIADMDSGGGAGDSDPAPNTIAATPKPEATAQPDPDDFDAVPAEITDSLNRKRVNSIPHPRVKDMIARKERALIATVAKELGITKAEAELQLDDVIGGLKERGTKLTAAEARIQQVEQVEAIMANEPERFLQLMVQVNPAYQRFLQQQAAQAQPQPQQVDDDPEPEPDFPLGNGQMTYSLEGMRKRDAWKERQIEKKLEGKLAERFKPVEDRIKAENERAIKQSQFQARSAKIASELEEARTWPQFKENEDAMLELLRQDKSISLHGAYMRVVMPKLAADRTKIRQEVVAEQNSQPKTTSVTSVVSPPKPDKPRTTADIAREVMAQLGNQ